MKKIFVAVATVLSTMIAHAGAVTWTAGPLTNPDGSAFTSGEGIAYLFTTTGAGAVTYDSIVEQLTNQTFAGAGAIITKATNASGTVTAANQLSGVYSGSQSMFMVIFSTSSVNFDDGTYYKITGLETANVPSGAGQGTFNFTSQLTGMNWTAVPEPATMALLGIGVVAVGLRRRRK